MLEHSWQMTCIRIRPNLEIERFHTFLCPLSHRFQVSSLSNACKRSSDPIPMELWRLESSHIDSKSIRPISSHFEPFRSHLQRM